MKVIEGHFTNEEVSLVAKAMQLETKLTGAKTATFVPKTVAAHNAGVHAGKAGALGATGFSLGSNICDVIAGDKTIGAASVDIAKDTAIGYGVGYAAGAAGSVVAGTSAGSAVIGAATTAGAAATGAVVGAVGTVGSAVTGAAVAATAAGAAAVAAAPVVAVGAAFGAACKIFSWFWDD